MDTLQPGQMLGPYRILNQIGKGGMATVYKAYQASVDRYVAIKVLPGQLAESEEFATRFHQEARIIAKLEHPHILPVHDYGETDGVAYFVMRYMEAGTLKDMIEAGHPFPLNEIDRIFTQLADALSYAHRHGVVHRDLKPANALIDPSGNIFLTDFGIAKLLESASPRLTQTDAIMGTPAYISPEQAQAQPVDQRSDIYSLGIILYEMVTGGVPFTADTPLAIILKHINNPLPLPSLIKPDIPASIEQVILKALAKDPKDRFATATEFVAAWKRALEEKGPIRQVPETVIESVSTLVEPKLERGLGVEQTHTTSAVSKAGKPTGWIVGSLAGACLLFSIAGVALFAFNRQNLSFLKTSTDTSISTQTVVSIPATTGEITQPTAKITPALTLTPDLCAPGNIEAEVEKVHRHMIEFEDASTRAASTPQEQLDGPIGELQRIRREAEDQTIPSCLTNLKKYQIEHMNTVITSLLIFLSMSDPQAVGDCTNTESNTEVADFCQNLALARQQHDQYSLEYDRLLNSQ